MNNWPQVRRTDKLMSEERLLETIESGYVGRLATVGADRQPYVIPLLYVWVDDEIWIHSTSARGHFRTNIEYESRVCFEIDEASNIYPYGRFECDTAVAYRSVVVFGRIRIVEDQEQKLACFNALMKKYADPAWDRPKGFYPSLDKVTVYAITPERMTGKENVLPLAENRWPAVDNTKTPDAQP